MDERFEKLHKGIPEADLRARKQSLRNNVKGEPNEEGRKLEINAITSIMTEEVWILVQEWLRKNQNKIVRKINNKSIEIITDSEYLVKENLEARGLEAYLIKLQQSTYRTIAISLDEWSKRKDSLEQDTEEYILFERYISLLEKEERMSEAWHEISRGINTAVTNIWLILSAIPFTYIEKFGRKISEDEFKKISENTLSLIMQIAALHLDIFSEFQFKYAELKSIELVEGLVPIVSKFEIIEARNGVLKLSLKDSVFELGVTPEISGKPRTKCPAIFSVNKEGKNIIAELHRYILNLSSRLFIPYLKSHDLVTP